MRAVSSNGFWRYLYLHSPNRNQLPGLSATPPLQSSSSSCDAAEDSPTHELVEDVDNHLDVRDLDGLLGGSNDGEGRLGRAVLEEASTRREESTDEEDLKKLLLILAVIELRSHYSAISFRHPVE